MLLTYADSWSLFLSFVVPLPKRNFESDGRKFIVWPPLVEPPQSRVVTEIIVLPFILQAQALGILTYPDSSHNSRPYIWLLQNEI